MSAGLRDAVEKIEESLDFFESTRGSLKKLELFDVADQILEVSLGSLETARRPVALRNRLTTPDEEDIRESVEPGREALIWKFDRGREGSAASLINTDKIPEKKNLPRSDVCKPFLGTCLTGATGTTETSEGVVEWLENLSNKFWRRRRYSSSLYPKLIQFKLSVKEKAHLNNPSEFATASSSSR